MSEAVAALAQLYQAVILDHGRNPRHARLPAPLDRSAERDNPFCGDRVSIGLRIEGASIAAIGFEGEGCLICLAAASLLCAAVEGGPLTAARALCERLRQLVATRAEPWPDELGDLAALSAVARFPAREQCATLACVALAAALAAA